jgi:hypothetical protein
MAAVDDARLNNASGSIRLRNELAEELYYPLNVALVLAELPEEEYVVVARFVGKCREARREIEAKRTTIRSA